MSADAGSTPKFEPSHRIIVLCGAERFLIEEYTRSVAAMLEHHCGGIEQFSFDGTMVEPAALLDELRSYGLMQRHKVVVLDHADLFLAGRKTLGGGDADDESSDGGEQAGAADEAGSRRPLFERYAANPVEDATLIMRCKTWRPSKLDAMIAKCGIIIRCDERPDEQAAGWCQKRCAKRYEATLEPAAARLLVQRVGPSLQRLDTEVAKLAAMAGQGQSITVRLVEEQIAPSREEKAWVIQSAIATRSASIMLKKLDDLLTDAPHSEWVPISWAVIDLLRKEHAASHLVRRNTNPQSIAKALRLWGESVGAVLASARAHEPADLAQLLRQAITADFHSKSGKGLSRRNLEALMVKIADV